jgi:Zn-dependent protease
MDPVQVTIALIAAGLIILIAFPIHEFSHALAAYRLGDSTARWQGRLTLDPRRHFDPLGGVMLIISSILGFGVGWAKPTPVNPYNLRYGRRGESVVALSGPLSNLIIAAVIAIPLRLIANSDELMATIVGSTIATIAWNIVYYLFAINISLFVFNLLPIPPLDGWKVLLGLVDARTAFTLRQFEQYGLILLAFIVLFGGRLLIPVLEFLLNLFAPGATYLPIAL